MYPTTVGLPVVPEVVWMRTTSRQRHGEEPERVAVAEVLLLRERDLPDVLERADLVGPDALAGQQLPVERDVLDPFERLAQPPELERLEVGRPHGLVQFVPGHWRGRRGAPPLHSPAVIFALC